MSAVIQDKPIETIFEHNVLPSEMESLFGGNESYSEYIASTSADEAYADLYFLYELRNDRRQAEIFLNKIVDQKYRNNFMNRCTH